MNEYKIELSKEEKKILDDSDISCLHTDIEIMENSKMGDYKDIEKIANSLFFKQILPLLSKNPGFIQNNIKKILPEKYSYVLYNIIKSYFWYLSETNLICREKKGSSYKIYLNADIKRIKESLEKSYDFSSRPLIQTTPYRRSKQMIIDYFGEDCIDSFEYRGKTDDVNKKWYLDRFLSSIGCCLKFDANEQLRKTIDKYWSIESEDKLKQFFHKYGFFSNKVYENCRAGNYKLPEIIGKSRYQDLLNELFEKTPQFKIKWCGYHERFKTIYTKDIPCFYADSLKFSWGLQPNLIKKKCKYCGQIFFPDREFLNIEKIEKHYPLEQSIVEVNFCCNHFPPVPVINEASKQLGNMFFSQSMTTSLKKLADIVGCIPPREFHQNLDYLSGLDKKQFEKAIKLLNDMPPYVGKTRRRDEVALGYKELFGSWFKALVTAGVLDSDTRKTARGYICLAEDGHECLSLGEKKIDDWLFRHDIEHEKEPIYPGEGRFRGDWKVGDYFMEYWGLKGEEDYDNKIYLKREIAKEHDILLIEISPSDLNDLDKKLSCLIKSKNN